jgi:hypothetical protein
LFISSSSQAWPGLEMFPPFNLGKFKCGVCEFGWSSYSCDGTNLCCRKVLAKQLKEEGDGSGEVTVNAGALIAQVCRLSKELRQLASSSQAATIVNGSPS